LPGEGIFQRAFFADRFGGAPVACVAFLRAEQQAAERSSYIFLVQFDGGQIELNFHPGAENSEAQNNPARGAIPLDAETQRNLVAAFGAGDKSRIDGSKLSGSSANMLASGAATIAKTSEGGTYLFTMPARRDFTSALLAVWQGKSPLIEEGVTSDLVIPQTSLDQNDEGATALGVTREGNLLWAFLTHGKRRVLSDALLRGGALYAVPLAGNREGADLEWYGPNVDGAIDVLPFHPSRRGSDFPRYLTLALTDFFYITRKPKLIERFTSPKTAWFGEERGGPDGRQLAAGTVTVRNKEIPFIAADFSAFVSEIRTGAGDIGDLDAPLAEEAPEKAGLVCPLLEAKKKKGEAAKERTPLSLFAEEKNKSFADIFAGKPFIRDGKPLLSADHEKKAAPQLIIAVDKYRKAMIIVYGAGATPLEAAEALLELGADLAFSFSPSRPSCLLAYRLSSSSLVRRALWTGTDFKKPVPGELDFSGKTLLLAEIPRGRRFFAALPPQE
jgi:hypothetical protein